MPFLLLGQSLAVSGVVFFAVLHLKPADALTLGTLIQTARLFGGEAVYRRPDYRAAPVRPTACREPQLSGWDGQKNLPN